MEMTQCDKCGDASNSEPGLKCGRTNGATQVSCTGTYQKTQTFVITASIYVDSVATPELAAKQVELLNNGPGMDGYGVDIRLPDPDSGYKWECVGGEEEPTSGPGQYSMMLDPKYNRSTPTAPEPTAKQLEIVESFRTNERIVEAGGEVTYEMLPDGVMMLRSTKDVGGHTRISRVPRDGHYGLVRWED